MPVAFFSLAFAIALTMAMPAFGAARELTVATLVGSDGRTTVVELPDDQSLGEGEGPPVVRIYEWHIDFDAVPHGFALFVPSMTGHARVEVNGMHVADTGGDAMDPPPRGADRIALFAVPDAVWRTGENDISIQLAGPEWVAMSKMRIGPLAERRHERIALVMAVAVGPSLVAAVVGTLGLCMLLLWARRGDALYGYFGAGTLGWSLNTAWAISPWSLLTGGHLTVWWTSLYAFFVAMLAIFCVRFANWRWPRFEQAMWCMAMGGPFFLYAGLYLGELPRACELWRFGLVAVTGISLCAVVRAAYRKPDTDRVLVALSGLIAFVFGIHDWLLSASDGGNNPVYLVPYAGLVFAVFVVRMLIDRFVKATTELEAMNARLEERVASQNAELRDAMEKMRAARDDAETANRAKSRFLAAASHDLRQPAHALALYMASLRSARLDKDQADLVQRMSNSLAALESMFNLLLDVSRVDAGAITVQSRTFSLEPILRHLAEEFAPEAESRGLRLSLRLPVSSRMLVHTDALMLEQVLRNLLANAVKYTFRGGILLACRFREERWRVEVWDTGIGISETDREHIFDEFYQVNNYGRDRSQGLGLGLSIVHRLIGLLGLQLVLRSRRERGSCFAVLLPQAASPVAEPGEIAPLRAVSLKDLTVAMIEDDVVVRDAMRTLLTRWGCRVFAGENADEIPGDEPMDVVLADHRLRDGRTGPDEATVLFERWGSRVPVLVVSGETIPKTTEYEWASKPVSPDRLRQWLDGVVRARDGGVS